MRSDRVVARVRYEMTDAIDPAAMPSNNRATRTKYRMRANEYKRLPPAEMHSAAMTKGFTKTDPDNRKGANKTGETKSRQADSVK